MKNFSTTIEGKEYWISRSISVAGFIFSRLEGSWYILANKRGIGAPDYQGYWNCPCGYLDYNETLTQACAREIAEETGVIIPETHLYYETIDDSINSNHQNVTVLFNHFDRSGKLIQQNLSIVNSEEYEVSEAKWLKVENINDRTKSWAFNHDKIITELIKFYLK